MPESGDAASAARLRRPLERRVLEEAKAAVRADGLAATLAHIALATAYARRVAEHRNGSAPNVVSEK